MKKSIILALVASAFTLSVSAQKYAVVNTQKVYQAIEAYAEAVEEIDELATAYQKNIDEAYQKVEEMYQNYMIARDGLTYEQQKAEEQNIIANEQKITTYQQNVFGTDGILTKKQEELLKPFHEKVATAIQNFATAGGYQMIVDIAITALPYYSPEIDITEEIIKLVK
ncbi:MAG: OmpH family outer membrane protein [Tidjanibacter sp.]|jgi:outer membrane protein|nr:OmpH family outer membrane protein [Tidjanibacter sp.]